MKETDIGKRFGKALRSIPEQEEIIRPDGSVTVVNRYHVVVNYGTWEQNHTVRPCKCGCGHGCGPVDTAKAISKAGGAFAVGGLLGFLILKIFNLGGA